MTQIEKLTARCTTKEQAKRYGIREAKKLTNRGFPYKLVEVKEENTEIVSKDFHSTGEFSRENPIRETVKFKAWFAYITKS